MKNVRTIAVAGLALAVGLALFAAPARADFYMKQKIHTGAFSVMGQNQPEKDEVMVFWMGADKFRTDTESSNSSILLLPDKKMLYMIDHAKKQYSEMPMDLGKMLGEAGGEEGKEEGRAQAMAMMKGMMGGMKATVTETAETKTIGNWNCRKYLVEMDMGMMGKMKAETWATEDLKIDYTKAFTMANAMMAGMPGFEKIIAEMKKIKGVVVLQTSTMNVMGGAEVKSTTELLEAGEKSAPAGHYDLPAGYKKVKGMMG
jgi:hypothetical protein